MLLNVSMISSVTYAAIISIGGNYFFNEHESPYDRFYKKFTPTYAKQAGLKIQILVPILIINSFLFEKHKKSNKSFKEKCTK